MSTEGQYQQRLSTLADKWRALALRGIVALIFGLVVLFWPGLVLAVLAGLLMAMVSAFSMATALATKEISGFAAVINGLNLPVLLLAGVLRAEMNLATSNGLYLVLLLLGGMVVPLAKLPGAMADVAKALPAAALAQGLHGALGGGTGVPVESWAVLGGWAVAALLAAALTFRWE